MGLIVQVAVAQAAIAVSVFSLITYLWLGLTVLLNGNRASLVTWVGSMGLLLAALFFLCHGALVGAGVPSGPSPTDFWWRLAWVPAFAAPLFWAAIGLHYAELFGPWKRFRLPVLQAVAALGALAGLLALLSWPAIAHYGDFIRLLDASLRVRRPAPPPAAATPALPLLSIAFVVYLTVCAFLPWISLAAARRLAARFHTPVPVAVGSEIASAAAFVAVAPGVQAAGQLSPDHAPAMVSAPGRTQPARSPVQTRPLAGADAALLWDARDAWARARPALLAASLLMMGTGVIVAAIGIMTSFAAHGASAAPIGLPVALPVPKTRPGHVPVVLVATDLVVQLALAGVGLAVGWAVVRQGILVERRLPQRGFLSHWRGMAIVAAVFATVIAGMASIEPEALPELLVLVALVSAAYALFTWQSYVAHDRMLAQLRPFVSSLALEHGGWLAADPADVERSVEALFTSLCRDVLGASRARLSLSAGRLHRTFAYQASELDADMQDQREWALPVSDERGVVARLVLGPRADGAGYTSADLEIARACGQRFLDAVGEFAAAQAIAALARQRGLEAELSAALPRRVLHDEVLPRLHLAMLRLEALGARLRVPSAVSAERAPTTADQEASGDGSSDALRAELGGVVRELGQAHHDLAALMRAAPIVNQKRLEHGMVSALRAALDGEFRGAFDQLDLDIPSAAGAAADALSPLVADLLLGATLEAVRNAGRHARGGDLHRRLALRVVLAADDGAVSIAVSDDGVGLQSADASPGPLPPDEPKPSARASAADASTGTPTTPGARSGLLTHAALVALLRGTLSVQSQPDAGTTVTIRVPRSSPLHAGQPSNS
jgi:hypothetical protein